MSGFKKFVLQGNLVDLAVAVIIGTSFGTVVTAFTKWLTELIPGTDDLFGKDPSNFGAFLNALVSFLILAAIVYFFVVVPYTKARDRFFPVVEEETGPSDEALLLAEIRDTLRSRA